MSSGMNRSQFITEGPSTKEESSPQHLALVEVRWIDAFDGPQGWVSYDDYSPTGVSPVTVGFLMKDFMVGHTSVCSSYFYDDNNRLIISNPIHIPTGMVKEVTPFVH